MAISASAQDYSTSDSRAIKSYENALRAFDSRNDALTFEFINEALRRDINFIEPYYLRFEVYSDQGNLAKAEIALEEAQALDPNFFPNSWFFLGSIEFSQGKYAEAKPHYEKFLTYKDLNPDLIAKTKKQLINCDFAMYAVAHPVDFEPENMGKAINSAHPEYYPAITTDESTFIFTRLNDDKYAYGGKDEDFYISKKRDGIWFPAVPLRAINSEMNEGAPTLSSDGRTLVFTACEVMGDYGSNRKGYGSCDLFISQRLGNAWQPPINMGTPINSPYWETQPSLSSDGNTLYFVRGKPSRRGVRNQDIYLSKRQTNNTWSTPVLISDKINTPDREESVHIHPDGRTLYFSSNGHPGMGGLDLYVSRRGENGEWGVPENLGYPINTFNDENSALVSPNGKLAFYASDRPEGEGHLDLYAFELPENVRAVPVTFVRGRVRDAETDAPIAATLNMVNVNDMSETNSFSSDPKNGEFLVALPTNSTYAMTVKEPGYLIHSETFTLSENIPTEGYALDVALYKIAAGNSVVLKNVFFDLDKAELKPQSKPELDELAQFLKANPNVVIEVAGYTDNQGSDAHNADLSQRRAEAVKQYLVDKKGIDGMRIQTKGYGAANPIASNETAVGRAQNRRTEFEVVSID